ncbi:hypothetical protein [Xanthomonas melonis]|uniref:Relaxation protein n=1 Tax=Xanthomonas melonis TaxID=56456 RepID=A0A2S7DEW0_9XANT|nr:hypothetical protein [Xanthomonas melonis]MCC4600200.1 hypothetical protein [Xanthomonas melonis]PPU72341.1 hypothetical protein XmelCFBP4644_12830 [Xanthomonas melonis]
MEGVATEAEVAAAVVVVVADSQNATNALNLQESTMDMQDTSTLPGGGESHQAMTDSIKAMTAVIAAMQRREQTLEDLVRHQMQLLQVAVNSADRRVTRVVESALPRLTQLSNQALTQTLEPGAERFNKKMVQAERTLEQATARYARAQQSLEATVTRRSWAGLAALLVGTLLCLAAVGYAVQGARPVLAEASQRRAEIAFLDRVARADLFPCGEDRLCVTLDKAGPRYGKRGQYRVVALRQPPAQ